MKLSVELFILYCHTLYNEGISKKFYKERSDVF